MQIYLWRKALCTYVIYDQRCKIAVSRTEEVWLNTCSFDDGGKKITKINHSTHSGNWFIFSWFFSPLKCSEQEMDLLPRPKKSWAIINKITTSLQLLRSNRWSREGRIGIWGGWGSISHKFSLLISRLLSADAWSVRGSSDLPAPIIAAGCAVWSAWWIDDEFFMKPLEHELSSPTGRREKVIAGQVYG